MNPYQFQKQYEELFLPLGLYALRLVGDTDVAQDVVQSAFESAWLKVGEIQNLKPYMYRAVRNAALMWLKENDRTEALTDDMDTPVGDDDMARSELDARLWRAIDGLPARCREIFLMCKRDGMSYAEIAQELDISVKTVDNQISRALRVLRGSDDLKHLKNFSVLLSFL